MSAGKVMIGGPEKVLWSNPGNIHDWNVLITPEYRALNAALHTSNPAYGISGGKWAAKAHRIAQQYEVRTLLDYGSGKGTLRMALIQRFSPDYDILEYDPAVPGRDVKPARVDMVVCGDVLEHIEPECLYAVLDDIRATGRLVVMLVAATRPAVKTLADGRNAHLIVEPAEWWLPKFMARWRVQLFEDRGGECLMIGVPR